MARVFLTKVFARYARKQGIEDAVLFEHIEMADRGQIDAKLSGCLVKIRIARRNEGKSGGYRTLVAYVKGEKAFYLFGFAKNERENIDSREERELEFVGRGLLEMNEQQLLRSIELGLVREITEQINLEEMNGGEEG